MSELSFRRFVGQEINECLHDLGMLRIEVFHDFPYLYEGSLAYEVDYLKKYVQAEKAMVFMVYDGEKAVGATTCIPLSEEEPEVLQPFIDQQLDPENYFYFGESILLKPYRGQGIGKRFFTERENHARSFNHYEYACFCSVIRPENHPLKPLDYVSNEAFWNKMGYFEQKGLVCTMKWQDVDQNEETVKELIFRTKLLKK